MKNWKKEYLHLLKNVCEDDIENYESIYEQPQPSFSNKMIYNKDAKDNALYKYKLDEQIATEQDYKDFCEYIWSYIGFDHEEEKSFSHFKKGK